MKAFLFGSLVLYSVCTTVTCLVSGKLNHYEEFFLQVPSNDTARAHLKYITSEPHIAGTPGDLKMATYVRDQLISYGIQAQIEPVETLLTYPNSRSLHMVSAGSGETIWEAKLEEEQLPSDATSGTEWRHKTFLAYTPSGRAAAPAVYANYGRPEDFAALGAAGVGVRGRVVLVRYGKCFRGLKVMNAQTRGAVAVLIYSDPGDDGYGAGAAYPAGPWRPRSGVQRGSADFISLCAGDPERRAGPASVEEVCGYGRDELIPTIPALPLSWGDALPLLTALGGPAAPADFQGGLNLTYNFGPSEDVLVHLETNNSFVRTPIWNVIGKIPGELEGDEDRPVVMGNHRDAWVFGAADPNSGTAVMLEVARGLGALARERGWRPRRSIYLASWSGEEYNLVGSTAWGEANAQGILKNAIAYLNCDTAVTGNAHLKILATPALAPLMTELTKHVMDPVKGLSLWEVYQPDIGTLGSGSDYAVFLDHLGIASTDFSFEIDAQQDYGVYHSIYDSFDWMAKWGDPGFLYHAAAARLWGLAGLALAQTSSSSSREEGEEEEPRPPLPFDHRAEAATLGLYVEELAARAAAAAPFQVDLGPLEAAVEAYAGAAAALEARRPAQTPPLSPPPPPAGAGAAAGTRGQLRGGGGGTAGASWAGSAAAALTVAEYDDRVSLAERRYLADEGLPLRKWNKNIKQAPGLYLGYSAEAFPGVVHAIRELDEPLAAEQVALAAECVLQVAAFLEGGAAGRDIRNSRSGISPFSREFWVFWASLYTSPSSF